MLQATGDLRIAIGIATAGRPGILNATLSHIARQTRLPDELLVCPRSSDDVDPGAVAVLPFPARVVFGGTGLARQRNEILANAEGYDIVVFFDDDFFPSPGYLAEVETLFWECAHVIVATGHVLEDGIKGPGLTPEHAERVIAQRENLPVSRRVLPHYSAYGCNMAIRLAPVRENGIAFDERLPLYGWQEDTDFSRQLAPFGDIVRAEALTGVHLGTKGGRSSGLPLGYSQFANPVYLIRKGTMSFFFGARLMIRNFLANSAKSLRPEPYVDRRGRLKGNIRALLDLFAGRLDPEGINRWS